MKPWIIALVVLVSAGLAFAQEAAAVPPPTEKKEAPPPAKDKTAPPEKETTASPAPTAAGMPATRESPLVKAARKNKSYKLKPGIVINNENVGRTSGEGGSVIQAPGAPPGSEASEYQFQEPVDAQGQGKKQWQKIMADARDQIAQADQNVRDLQSRVNQLETDYYSRDDPAVRDGVIKPARDKALADLESARQRAQDVRKRIIDLEEEARKAGALPGWLR